MAVSNSTGMEDSMGQPLSKRRFLHEADFRKRHPAARAFLAPQYRHKPKVQHPKPRKPVA